MHWLNRPTIAMAVALACLLSGPLSAAGPTEEQRLVNVLQSDRSAKDRSAACVRLKQIGTARSVAALAGLLATDELSHSARYALESMPWPQAGAAMVAALTTTNGLTKVGLIDSLGVRREARAVGPLVKLLEAKDEAVASSAAVALGRIGGGEALRGLTAAQPKARATVLAAMTDASLPARCSLLRVAGPIGGSAVGRALRDGVNDAEPAIRDAAIRTLAAAGRPDALGDLLELARQAPSETDTAWWIAYTDSS